MANANRLIEVALSQVGYDIYSDPEIGSKYGRWYAKETGESYYGLDGVPYCAMFDSWCLYWANVECAGFPNASCTSAWRKAKSLGNIVVPREIKAGDIVMYDFDDSGDCDHTGICVSAGRDILQVIEGNTSASYTNAQYTGGKVVRKNRGFRYVKCGIRPKFDNTLEVDGYWGTATTMRLQEIFGCTQDGIISGQSSWACDQPSLKEGGAIRNGTTGSVLIENMQAWLGLSSRSGRIDNDFVRTLQRKMRTVVDGELSAPSLCVMEIQRHCNLGDILTM